MKKETEVTLAQVAIRLVEVNINLNTGRALIMVVPESQVEETATRIGKVGYWHLDVKNPRNRTFYPVTSINNINYMQPEAL